MTNVILIPSLALITLVIVVAYLIIDRIGVAKAKDQHTHSAVTESKPGLRDG